MPEELSAVLDLDYGDAIAGADALGSAIEQSMSEGASAGTSAVADALSGLTAEPIEVPVEADVGTAQGEIDTLTAEPIDVPVDADTSSAQGEISQLEGQTQLLIPVEADTAGAQGELFALASDTPTIEVPVEIDDAGAADSLNQIGDSSSGAAAGLRSVGEGGGEASGGMGEAGAAAGALGGALAGTGSRLAGTVAGVSAATFGFHELFNAGIEAATGTERLHQAAGPLAEDIQHIRIGNLNTDLRTLGNQFGSTGAEMDSAAAKAFQFATAGGFSAIKSVEFSQGIAALAARAVALNPALGNVADVADTMSTSFGRVLLAAKKYNLALSSSEVSTRALADTGKTATNQLTVQEKAVAAVEVATAKYGDTLAQKIADGADLAANKQKSLIATGKEVAEVLGRPLAEGALNSLSALQGPVESLVHGFSALPDPIQRVVAGLIAYAAVSKLAGLAGINFSQGILRTLSGTGGLAGSLPVLAGAAGVAGLAIGVMGVESGNTAQAIGGMALAGAAFGTLVAPGIGTAVGAAGGALVGFVASLHGGSDELDATERATQRLNKAVTSGSIPAIILATDAVQRATTTHGDFSGVIDAADRAIDKFGTHLAPKLSQSYEAVKIEGEAFQKALAKSPEAAFTTIAAYDKLGISTEIYQNKLNASVRTQQLAQQSSAQLTSAAAPLKVTFEEASTAVGGLTDRQFQVAAAGSQALDSLSKIAPAQDKFNAAIKDGNAEGIEQAANARATAEAQNAYNSTLLATGSATQAATAASGTFRASLGTLLDSIPPDNPAHAAIQGIIDQMDNLAAHPATIDLKVDGGSAALQLASINKAIDDIISHPKQNPVKIFMDDTEATAKLDGINQARQILSRDPTKFQVVMDDLATGKIDNLNAILAALPPVKSTKVDADTGEARSNIVQLQGQIDNTHGKVHVDGDATGAHASTQEAKVTADATTGRIRIDGDPSLAQGAVTGAKVYADSTTGKITIGGDNAPANSVIVGTVTTANGSTGTITVDGQDAPVRGKIEGSKGHQGDAWIDIDGKNLFKTGDYGTIGSATIAVHGIFAGLGAEFASGGTVAYGGGAAAGRTFGDESLVTVGEHGKELALLPGGTRIFNATQTRAIGQRAGREPGDSSVRVDTSELDAAAAQLAGAAELLIAVTGLGSPPSRRILARR